MADIDTIIIDLVSTGRQASDGELRSLIAHVAQTPFATYLSKVPGRVRRPLTQLGQRIPPRMPSVEWHLLERVYVDQQWPVGTTVLQYLTDLHNAVQHPAIQVWTYRYFGIPCAGFLAPSHIQQVPKPEAYIFVTYNSQFSVIVTGYQASSAATAMGQGCIDIVQHR